MFDGYILCATPRSGSTLLCKLLSATGAAGEPNSYYSRKFMAEWAEDWHLPAPGTMSQHDYDRCYLEAAIRVGKGGTGIFGLRLMRENLEDMSAIMDGLHPRLESDKARFEAAFGKVLFIHLSRADKLAQAVSLVKAEQSGLWHVAPDGSELERLALPQEPRYDFERIRREVAELDGHDAAWNTWYAGQRIEPLRINYDELAADPAATLIRICTALSVEPPPRDAIRPGVARLADAMSREWMRRYRADLAAAG